jgi:orotidine-5'-phosphate decarboxylase
MKTYFVSSVPMKLKAVCKAETCKSRRQTNRATNRIVCPQYRHQRCHSGGKGDGGGDGGLQSSSTVECSPASSVPSNVKSGLQSGRHAAKQKTDQQSDQQSSPSVSTPNAVTQEAKATEEATVGLQSQHGRGSKAFVRRQCRDVKAVCKAEDMQSRRQTNRATNRIVCPQYRHQRCHQEAKATEEATVGLQSSSTVECRLKAFVRRQCRRMKAVCKAEDMQSRRQTNRATNRIVCPQYRHQRCHSEAKATEEATVDPQSQHRV